jgi:regulatory protein
MSRNPYEYGLDLLSARAYTVRNLRRKMEGKGFDARDIEAAVGRLVSSGLLDDRKFAFEFARQKIVVGGAATRRVRQALILKGIASQVVDDAIAELISEEEVDHEEAIEKIAVKKLRSMTDLDAVTQRRRLFGFLARKGYEVDDVKRVVGRLLP